MTGIALHLLRAIKSASGGGGLVAANHIPPPTAGPRPTHQGPAGHREQPPVQMRNRSVSARP
jgi:hypothetical protein